MPSQSINFAQLQYLSGNGSSFNRLNRPGGTRLWERVWVSSGYNQYVSQGYWYDPPGYNQTLYGRKTGWWDLTGGSIAASLFGIYAGWGLVEPYIANWTFGYQGWLQVTGYYGYGDLWQWYYDEPVSFWVDPGPYWVDTSYYYWVDTSYWAYYY
jgi:hypothetical protein|nr:hypothetical protein [Oxalobacteraceae bacterium]